MAKELILPQEVEHESLIYKKINKTPVNKDSIFGMTKETDHKVRGYLVNIEYPGQTLSVNVKGYYKGMPYFSKVLNDGESIVIPLSVARHINEMVAYEEHKHIKDDKGNDIKSSKRTPRAKFMIEEHLK